MNREEKRKLARLQAQAVELGRRAKSVQVLYVHPGTVHAGFMDSILALLVASPQMGLTITLRSARTGPLISRARNILLERFLKDGADYALFIDTDQVFSPQDIQALVDSGRSLISPVYYSWDHATNDRFPVVMRKRDGDSTIVEPYTEHALHNLPKPVAEVYAIGMGCCLIRRDAAQAVAQAGPRSRVTELWPFAEVEVDGAARGEDIAFCMRARDAGHPPYVLTDREIGHEKMVVL